MPFFRLSPAGAPVPSVKSVGSAQGGHMIEARGLTKRYGEKLAVDNLSFTVRPGVVTGFLGPNGAGKPDHGL
jgi:ABC-type uncharacterized transport system ATPase subunit